ncbi:PREDICTED: pentatricopeptide repeat-containing [Prunus dulcis]|uniref:PREDICTED: pentatricopeptide repeat-containing n=1 Tax=Prunus dulcis TaxID=3755 RepID=A0A5E4E7G3_PRUDU|nr:hypothetical protein L3X38_040229 [Prunus dulcis]VVA10671.1 PREDICTED: pentatricopeptide repeat-containing [Prunus dulcis]
MAFCTDPSLGNLYCAEKVFHYIQNPCLFVYNRMIKAFAKRGSFRSALELFRRLREEGLWPDSFTYPFVFKAIGCLREPREGAKVHGLVVKTGFEFDARFEDAFDMFQRMRCESNKKPDEATVVSTVSACTALKNLELGRRIFDEIPSKSVVLVWCLGV